MASKHRVQRRRILITTGDADGIGWEVTAKALAEIGPRPGVQFVFFRHVDALEGGQKFMKGLGRFKPQICNSLADAARAEFSPRTLIEVRSRQSPAHWVEEAAAACLRDDFQALVTAPLSKTTIIASGLKDIGHTEILARVSGARELFMGFWGEKFCVVLATGHAPLSQALTEFTPQRLRLAAKAAEQLRQLLPAARARRPIALVGVNPHAGEGGLLGQEENWMRPLAKELKLAGPMVPDAAFLPINWTRHSVYICPYHDQGLIPFKMIHGFDSGVHLTLGLPFVRTSVDHGTAKEIFGRGRAQAGSMRDALMAALKLTKETKR